MATNRTIPKMTPRSSTDDHATTEQRLLHEAARLFRKRGFDGTSTRELAAAVGLRSASLYYYMDTKEDLLHSICMAGNQLMIDAVSTAIEGLSPHEALRAVIRTHLENAIAHRDVYLTTLTEARALSPRRRREVAMVRQAYSDLLTEVLERAQAAGEVRSDLTADHLMLVLRNILSWTLVWYRPDGDLSIAELADLMERVFLEGASA